MFSCLTWNVKKFLWCRRFVSFKALSMQRYRYRLYIYLLYFCFIMFSRVSLAFIHFRLFWTSTTGLFYLPFIDWYSSFLIRNIWKQELLYWLCSMHILKILSRVNYLCQSLRSFKFIKILFTVTEIVIRGTSFCICWINFKM